MVTNLFYVFQPTVALTDAMMVAEEKYTAEVSVWTTKFHDRVGQEHSQERIESSFWTVFLRKLVAEAPEPVLLLQLREKILNLGFDGCWSVVCTGSGGPASELIDDAADLARQMRMDMTESQCLLLAEQFLRSRGIGYLPSGRIGRKEGNRMEAIFDIRASIDPAVAVCDPPNVRVWVMPSESFVELIHEM